MRNPGAKTLDAAVGEEIAREREDCAHLAALRRASLVAMQTHGGAEND